MSLQAVSKTFAAIGATGAVYLRPFDRITYTLVCGGSDEFIGTVEFQRSTTGGQTWETVTAYTGTVAEPLSAAVADVTYRHLSAKGAHYRLAVTDYDDETDITPETSDPIDGTLATLDEVIREAVLENGVIADRGGQPLLSVREDGIAMTAAVVSGLPLGVFTGSGAPVSYTDGDPVATGQDVAGTGAFYIDTNAGTVYVNTGDADQPTWGALAVA